MNLEDMLSLLSGLGAVAPIVAIVLVGGWYYDKIHQRNTDARLKHEANYEHLSKNVNVLNVKIGQLIEKIGQMISLLERGEADIQAISEELIKLEYEIDGIKEKLDSIQLEREDKASGG